MKRYPIIVQYTITACFAILLYSGCSSPNETTPDPIKVQDTSKYSLRLERTNVWIGDTLRIFGKHLGTNSSNVTVFFDTLRLAPITTMDTCITIVIQKNVSPKKYQVSISILGDTVKKFATLNVLQLNQKKVEYNLSINKVKAWANDSVKISGKYFGENIASVTVYFDDIALVPKRVLDTSITFIIPSTIALKKYNVSVRLADTVLKNFAILSVQTQPGTVDYQPRIEVAKAYRGDTIKIYGKHFGNDVSAIRLFLETYLYIFPLSVNDTCLTLQIYPYIPVKQYTLSLKIYDDTVKNFAVVSILSKWEQFQSVEISMRIHGDSTFRTDYGIDSIMQTTINRTINPLYGYDRLAFENAKNGIKCNYKYSESYHDPGNLKTYSFNRSKDRTFEVEIDTVLKKILNMRFSQSDYEGQSGYQVLNYTLSEYLGVLISEAGYKEIENGIEIYFDNNQIALLPNKPIYFSTVGTIARYRDTKNFTPKPPFAADNFLKIVFLR